MKQFKITPDGLRQIQKQLLFKIIPFMVIAIGVGIAMGSLNSKKETDSSVLLFIIPFVACVVGFSLYRSVNRQISLLKSFTLTLTNNIVGREQLNTHIITVYHNDIREIVKNKNGSFTIKGKESTDIIYVPAQIENPTELEEELSKIKPVGTKNTGQPLQKYQLLFPLFTLGLMLSVYMVTNKIVVAISGSLFVATMLWSLIYVQRSKNVDRKTKRNIWWVLVVLASVLWVMVMKLST
jgi:hypothetical protein